MLGPIIGHLAHHMKNNRFMQTVSSSWTGWLYDHLLCGVPIDQSAHQGSPNPGLTLQSNLLTLLHHILISTYFNWCGQYNRLLGWVWDNCCQLFLLTSACRFLRALE